MKVVMTLLVRNEEDILAHNIEYHLARGIDFILARDNLSIDGTKTILMEYQRQGVLHYQFEPRDTYEQTAWVTEMAQMAYAQFEADWVIHSDADEFWWPESENTMKQVLSNVQESTDGLIVTRYNFPPRSITTSVNFLSTMIFRESHSLNSIGDPLPPKVCHRAADDIVVAQGNHSIASARRPLDVRYTDEICIFHFPIRTLRQITSKIRYGGAAYERSSLPPDVGGTWRRLFDRLNTEGLEGYYNENLLDDFSLDRRLESHEIVVDRRLLEFFAENDLRPLSVTS